MESPSFPAGPQRYRPLAPLEPVFRLDVECME
jgi:hypothetical protein